MMQEKDLECLLESPPQVLDSFNGAKPSLLDRGPNLERGTSGLWTLLSLRLGRHMMAGVIMTALCRHYASAVMHAVQSIMLVFGVRLAVAPSTDSVLWSTLE